MEVPHLNFFIQENSLIEGAQNVISFFRPNWDLSLTQFKVFRDGITNKLLGCFNKQNKSDVVLIRVYGNKTDLLIDRKKEAENIRDLHSAGLAPALYGTFLNGIVYEFVPGEVLDSVSCRSDDIFRLVATKLADMHAISNGGKVREPDLWKVIAKFLSHVPENFSNPEKEKRFNELFLVKPDFNKEISFLKEKLLPLSSPVVFCHNDLLLGNVIYNSENSTVTFIDYEYAAYNYQSYDIANHFNEFAGVENVDYELLPDDSFQKKWLRIYLERYNENLGNFKGHEVTDEELEFFMSAVQKFTLASHFLWGIWSLLQAEHSSLEFDFLNYALIRYTEYYKRKKQIFNC